MSELCLASGDVIGLLDGRAPSLEDVILGLDTELRWRGRTSEPWSVGKHLLLCLFLARRLNGLPSECSGAGLHDVEESVLGDIPTPQKMLLRVALPDGAVASYEDGLGRPMRARILAALGAPISVAACESDFVKKVDAIALRVEARALCHPALAARLGPAPANARVMEYGAEVLAGLRGRGGVARLLMGEVLW